ncbi:heme/hemin ABC transporter substrate-binding protein [Flavobacterium notoginsengisoli]|uniref:heme/hemin ABC transporter substrate-binding protein n=1 Tax=Flavobacterium notoginsengisoli TaxID=1478199 RepID=UPI00362AB6C9
MKMRIWRNRLLISLLFFCSFLIYAQPKRIITLGGAITETVAELGFEKQIIAVDVTSEYPQSIKKLPKVSKNRSVSAEGLMGYRPDLIIAPYGDVPYGVIQSLKGAGIRFVAVKQEYSVKGALQFIREVGTALGEKEKGNKLALETGKRIDKALQTVKLNKKKPEVLFIYARGTGTMTVAGKGSNMDAIIALAGGRNAIQEFNRYKTYSTEALVSANPDVLFLFDFGIESLGGTSGLLKMPGVAYTNAGKNKRIAVMDGPLMINFATRLDQAILVLHKEFIKS